MKNNYKVLVLGAGLIGTEVSNVCNSLEYENLSVDIVNGDKKINLLESDSLNEVLYEFQPNVVFNTAGMDQKLDGTSQKLHEMSDEEWEEVFSTNSRITLSGPLKYITKRDSSLFFFTSC